MKNALITGKTDSPRLKPVFEQLQKELALLGVDSFIIAVDEITDRDFDIVFSVGGDGNFVGAVRKYIYYDVPVVAVKGGTIGFLTNIEPRNFKRQLPKILDPKYNWTKRMALAGKKSSGENIVALNEFMFSSSKKGLLSEFSVYIDNKQVMKVRADAILLATPTGSTAYNLSAGGPISLPDMEVITITPVCSHILGERPLIIDTNSKITILNECSTESRVWADGQASLDFACGESFTLTKPQYIKSLNTTPKEFFSILSKKLGWNRGGK